MVFSMFRVRQPSPQSILELFHHPKKPTSFSALPAFSSSAPTPGSHSSYFVSMDLPILGISYKRDLGIRGLLRLAAFSECVHRSCVWRPVIGAALLFC